MNNKTHTNLSIFVNSFAFPEKSVSTSNLLQLTIITKCASKRAAISIEYLSNYLETRAILHSGANSKELSIRISMFQQDFVNFIFIFSWFQSCQPCYTGQINGTGSVQVTFFLTLSSNLLVISTLLKKDCSDIPGSKRMLHTFTHRHTHSLCFIF